MRTAAVLLFFVALLIFAVTKDESASSESALKPGKVQQVAQQDDEKPDFSTRTDPSVTPWRDPNNPMVILRDPNDPTAKFGFTRNSKPNPKRDAGPIDLQRYDMNPFGSYFPTLFGAPIAMNKEDLIAGDVDIALVGSTADNNPVPGTAFGANMLRGFIRTAGKQLIESRGGGKMERRRDGIVDMYLHTYLNEVNVVDYGNITTNPFEQGATSEEIRRVINEIYAGKAKPVMVAGSHDGMYGMFLATADTYGRKNFGIIHFDSHYDALRNGPFGAYIHNGNGISNAIIRNLVDGKDIIQVGMTCNGPNHVDYKWLNDHGVKHHYAAEIERDGWDAVIQRCLEETKDIENLVITLDIDIMAANYVPGTGGREVDGITPKQMAKMLRALTIQNNVVALDVAEYNPMMDSRSFQTAEVMMFMLRNFIAAEAARRRGITDPLHYDSKLVGDEK